MEQISMFRAFFAAAAFVAFTATIALAQPSTSLIGGGSASTSLLGGGQPSTALIAPRSNPRIPAMTTSRGPAVVSGAPGSVQTTLLPGAPSHGVLSNNPNGVNTSMTPGGVPTAASPIR